MLSIRNLQEGADYGSPKLFIIEVNVNGYWKTWEKDAGSMFSGVVFQAYAKHDVAQAQKNFLASKDKVNKYRVVSYAPIGAS